MAQKSHSGKKKRPLYGPKGSLTQQMKTSDGKLLTQEEVKERQTTAKRLSRERLYSIGLLLCALILLMFAMLVFEAQTIEQQGITMVAYILSLCAGFILLRNQKATVSEQKLFLPYMILGLGVVGIIITGMEIYKVHF